LLAAAPATKEPVFVAEEQFKPEIVPGNAVTESVTVSPAQVEVALETISKGPEPWYRFVISC
jgi:hypothetical protein